jgi:hypothetical protein
MSDPTPQPLPSIAQLQTAAAALELDAQNLAALTTSDEVLAFFGIALADLKLLLADPRLQTIAADLGLALKAIAVPLVGGAVTAELGPVAGAGAGALTGMAIDAGEAEVAKLGATPANASTLIGGAVAGAGGSTLGALAQQAADAAIQAGETAAAKLAAPTPPPTTPPAK